MNIPLVYQILSVCRNRDEAEMDMLRRTMGLGFPLKLQMERKAVSKVSQHYSFSDSSFAEFFLTTSFL